MDGVVNHLVHIVLDYKVLFAHSDIEDSSVYSSISSFFITLLLFFIILLQL